MLTFTRPVYDQQAVAALIQPKEIVTDDGDEGFFSALEICFPITSGLQVSSSCSFFSALGIGYLVRSSRIR